MSPQPTLKEKMENQKASFYQNNNPGSDPHLRGNKYALKLNKVEIGTLSTFDNSNIKSVKELPKFNSTVV